MQSKPQEIYPKNNVTLRDWEDSGALRKDILEAAKHTMTKQFPQSWGGVRLELHDVDYDDPAKDFSLSDQKEALMTNKFLSHRLRGTFKLFDEKTGDQLDEQRTTLMRVPHLSDRHTFIHNGSEYATVNQARLLPGAYTRRRESGELETHFNARRGTGPSFWVEMEPQTGLFRMRIGQAHLRLYSLLHDLGIEDKELEQTWGPELLEVNRGAYDKRVFDKAYERLVRYPEPGASKEAKIAAIKEALGSTKLSKEVMGRTLPSALHKSAAVAHPDVEPPVGPVAAETEPTTIDPNAATTPIAPLGGGEPGIGLTKEDMIGIAMLLNQTFKAGIPLQETMGQMTEDIRGVVNENLPGLHPDLVAALQKEAAIGEEPSSPDYEEKAQAIHDSPLSTGASHQVNEQDEDTKHQAADGDNIEQGTGEFAKLALTPNQLEEKAQAAATGRQNDLPQPSPAQREAGNYRKGHVWLHGLNISIENPRGSIRSGVSPRGKKWRCYVKHHYGYIRYTRGADGDQVDVFIGPNPKSRHVYIVNQLDPKTKTFDEHKAMLGFDSEKEAKEAYLSNYEKNWQGLGSIAYCSMEDFKEHLPLFRKGRSFSHSLDMEKAANQLPIPANDPLKSYMDFTAPLEGVRTTPYLDSRTNLTTGVGMNLNNPGANSRLRGVGMDPKAFRAGKTNLNMNQVTTLYHQDMQDAVGRAQKLVPSFGQQPAPVQKSLADLSFNLGSKLKGFEKFRGNLTTNNYAGAASELQNSNWFKQVPNRARTHMNIYNGLAATQTNSPAGGANTPPGPAGLKSPVSPQGPKLPMSVKAGPMAGVEPGQVAQPIKPGSKPVQFNPAELKLTSRTPLK